MAISDGGESSHGGRSVVNVGIHGDGDDYDVLVCRI